MPGVQARLRSEHKRRYLDLDPTAWYQVVPVFPGVTQRMVNMAGERLARLATPKGFTTSELTIWSFARRRSRPRRKEPDVSGCYCRVVSRLCRWSSIARTLVASPFGVNGFC